MNNNPIVLENIIEAEINFNNLYKKNNEKVIANLKNFCLKNNIRASFNDSENKKIVINIFFGNKELLLNEIFNKYRLTFNAVISENTIILTNNEIFSNNQTKKEIINTLKYRLRNYKNSVMLKENKLSITVKDYNKLSNDFLNNLFKKSYLSVNFGLSNNIHNELTDVEGYNKITYKIDKNEVFNYSDIKKIWIDFSTKRAILKIKFKDKNKIEEFTKNNQGKILTFLVNNKVVFQIKIASIVFNGTFQEMFQNYDEARQILSILQTRPFVADVNILSNKINLIKPIKYLNIYKFLLVLFIFSMLEVLTFTYYNKLRRTK